MAGYYVFTAPGSGQNLLTTELNALANNGVGSGTIYNNTSGYLYGDFQYGVKYQSSVPTAGTISAELYLVPSIDNTNYAPGSGTLSANFAPQAALLAATFEARASDATVNFEYLDVVGVPLPYGSFKPFLINKSGKTLAATGNTLYMRPTTIKLQNE